MLTVNFLFINWDCRWDLKVLVDFFALCWFHCWLRIRIVRGLPVTNAIKWVFQTIVHRHIVFYCLFACLQSVIILSKNLTKNGLFQFYNRNTERCLSFVCSVLHNILIKLGAHRLLGLYCKFRNNSSVIILKILKMWQ